MCPTTVKIAWILIAGILLASSVQAGHITLATSMRVAAAFDDGQGIVEVEMVNRGDEAAYDVRLIVEPAEYFSAPEASAGLLVPGRTATHRLNVTTRAAVADGSYPFVLKIRYADANGHPFSIVSPLTVDMGKSAPAGVSAFVERIILAPGSGATMDVVLRNPGTQTRTMHTLFFGPDEIDVREREKTAYVPAGGQAPVGYYLGASERALPGSNYAVLVAVTYEEGDLHHTRFVAGRVGIGQQPRPPAGIQGPLEDGRFLGLAGVVLFLTGTYIYLDAKVS